MKFKTIILMLSCSLFFSVVSCNDNDYSDDIDSLKKELAETKAAIKTLQDLTSALQKQLFIDSYEKTGDGYVLKMSDGSKIIVTQGEKGDDGTDAPVITDINEIEDSLEFIFSDGNKIVLPRNEKYDVITVDIEVTNIIGKPNFDFLVSSSYYFGNGPLFSIPQDLEINWGDGKITGGYIHEYKAVGAYTITLKAKQIHGLKLGGVDKVTKVDISKCSNIQYLSLSNFEGDITISNSPSLIEISGGGNNLITKLNLDNLSNLRYVEIGSFYTETSPLKAINITDCPKMEILDFASTMLTSIDVSGLTNLYELKCSNSISTIWVWDGFDPVDYSDWSVPVGVEYKVK